MSAIELDLKAVPSSKAMVASASLGWSQQSLEMVGAAKFGELYYSELVLENEIRRVLSSTWSLVGTLDQLPDHGSYLTVDRFGSSVAIIRRRDGGVDAFVNVCTHRGMELLVGEGRLRSHITCPYHQWSFDLEGSVVKVPQVDQFVDVDLSELSLKRIDSAVWYGMIFLRMAEDGPSFADWITAMDDRLGSFLSGPLVEVGVVKYRVKCNWKLLVENHVDVYHLWYLHSRSLREFDHRSFRWSSVGDHWWSYEPLKSPETVGTTLEWIDPIDKVGIGAHLLFPNTMLVTTGEYFASYDALPVSAVETEVTLRVRSTKGKDGDRLIANVRSFLGEDIVACEGLQRSVAGERFALGPLAVDHELPIRNFHGSLRRILTADRAEH